MEIKVAKKAGACFGVNRSLQQVSETAKIFQKVVTLGDLIHNPKTVQELKTKLGVVSVQTPQEAADLRADCVVIRSHGVTLQVEEELKALGLHVVDATCPHVKHVQKTAADLAKSNRAVVVVGKASHPEVQGVCSYIEDAGAQAFCISNDDELQNCLTELQNLKIVGVVSQTTQSQSTFQGIVEKLQQASLELTVKNTICAATAQRQAAAEDLSTHVDAFIVIGGKNSSNTTHLAEIVRKNCPNTQHVESASDIDLALLANAHTIGLSAGASTPASQIASAQSYLNSHLA